MIDPPPPPPPPPSYGVASYPAGMYVPYAYHPTAPAGPAPGERYAGFWVRFAAYIIDAVLLDVPTYAVAFGLLRTALYSGGCTPNEPVFGPGFGSGTFCSYMLTGAFWLVFLGVQVLHAVYFILLWSLAGSSLGQKAFGLRIVDANNGARISIGRAALRFLGYLVSGVVFDLGFMWAGWDPRKQGWHDKIAGTFVVKSI